MINEHLEELAALHAVGLLDDVSRDELLRAMSSDPEIDRLVREYTERAALLALEVPQIKPSTELKQDILHQLPPRKKGAKTLLFSAWMPYAIAACLMLVAIQQARHILALKSKLGAANADVARLTASNALMGLRLTELEAKNAAYQSSRILVAWDPYQHRGVISMQNLPAPAPGHNYQLWVLDPGALAPISAGLIHPEGGSGAFTAPPLSIGSPGFAITLEPGEGSPEPTSSILFAVAPVQ